jgi:cellulose biosynthesis protein BcsQ
MQQRVLVIDMDGQASLTTLLPPPASPRLRGRRGGAAPKELPLRPPTLPDYLLGRKDLVDLVRPTTLPGLWIIPSEERLVSLDLAGATRPELLAFVRDLHDGAVIAPDGKPVDWILLDTAPAQSFSTRAALAASHDVVLPACAEVLAVRGANIAVKTTRTMRALTRDGASLLGGVITRWKASAPANKSLSELVDAMNNEHIRLGGSSNNRPHVYASRLPDDGRVERGNLALRGGLLRHLFRLTHVGAAAAYEAFARELMTDANRREAEATDRHSTDG